MTDGSITIKGITFVNGKEVDVSQEVGRYIKENFNTIFDITEEKRINRKAKKEE